ncbi:MAG TPA: alpha-glucan family phosphorylase [Candidatus Sulfopaludibacter sp.]|jgi:starch phosphorylase|nr:alpha-glucan family phosphorylase [Candidatus Sulfopaludibacter sp.]
MSNLKYTNFPSEAPEEDALAQLALDVGWTWNDAAAKIWASLNPELWELTHNPWVVLQTVSGVRLTELTGDPAFQATLQKVTEARRAAADLARWFQQTHPNPPLTTVAYFSMEYMLSEALPIYSGGLGNVAGDQLKAADDLGVPVVAVGLLYDQGYFRQEIDRDGNQRALYPYNDPGQLPIRPVRNGHGDWLRLNLSFPGCSLWVRTWEVQVGRTRLYLLDTNDPANIPEYRGITSELYGGGPDLRIRQELLLGIGGWRLLGALGLKPEVCHLNEGHASFAVLERAAAYMEETGHPFSAALSVTRAGNLFTTHTPVEAGFDRFPPELMRMYLQRYCATRLHISFDDLMALGRRNAGDSQEPFNMAFLAMRTAGAVNGVSRLHGEVSRTLFQPLFPRWPTPEVPIGHVTNGVHVTTWQSDEATPLWKDPAQIRQKPDAEIWGMRTAARESLVGYVRSRYARQVAIQGGCAQDVDNASAVFDPQVLTLGFARRFATYKRPNLLLRDAGRLTAILRNRERPVQLVIAGKAHPADGAGQEMIRQWSQFIRDAGPHSPVIFLSDYDMLLTGRLVGGVDVWVNTPRRPWEASGTSGMKVLSNGGLNLSELDGWWAEAYTPDVGWALGDGSEHGDDPAWDAAEAVALYELIERQIVPEFYERGADGIPHRWVGRIRESMARLTPEYSAARTVREYTEKHYLPRAAAYADRAAANGRVGLELDEWKRKIDAGWQHVAFGKVQVEGNRFEVTVYLGEIDPSEVAVELFADGPVRIAMQEAGRLPDGGYRYTANADGSRSAGDYTARIVPHHDSAAVPLETGRILWQR